MNEIENLRARGDELIKYFLNTGDDLSIDIEFKKIVNRLEVIHNRKIDLPQKVLEVPVR